VCCDSGADFTTKTGGFIMLNEAKCTNCGANIKVDPTKEAAVCEYCGSAFIVEKAINNYNITNAQITSQTVNVSVGLSDFVIEKGVLKEYRGNDSEITIPNSVMVIAPNAFHDCITIKSVIVPNSVKSIGGYSFSGCVNLRSITFLGGLECAGSIFCDCSIAEIKTSGDIKVDFPVTPLVFPNDLSNEKPILAAKWIVFLRGYRTVPTIENVKKPAKNGKNSYDRRPLYVNGNNVIDELIEKVEKGCYIATAVYGDYDAPQVFVLRHFRDNTLAKSTVGRLIIKTYYHLSPPIARWLKNTHRLNALVRGILDRFVAYLSKKSK
jgi:hypothetical protein